MILDSWSALSSEVATRERLQVENSLSRGNGRDVIS